MPRYVPAIVASPAVASSTDCDPDHADDQPQPGSAVVVEAAASTGYAVTTRPLRFELQRHFPLAWQALEHAEILAGEIGARVLDRTGVAA